MRSRDLGLGRVVWVFCFTFLVFVAKAQVTIHVPGDQPSIQAGIDAAHDGDTVLVAPGTYNENIDYKGKLITLTSGAKAYDQAAGFVLEGDGKSPVVSIKGSASLRPTLNGFTIRSGIGTDPIMCGGIAIDAANPTISNNVVTGNQSCGISISNGGGGLLQGNDIRENIGNGLLIYMAGDITLNDNVIEGNVMLRPNDTTQSRGAGLTVATLNSATTLAANSLRLEHNIIRFNVADIDSAFAQAIFSVVRTLTFVNNLIYGNVNRNLDPTQVYLSGSFLGPSQPIRTSLTEINNTIVGGGQFLAEPFAPSVIANNVFLNTKLFPYAVPFPQYAGLSCAFTGPVFDIRNNNVFNVGRPVDGGCTLGSGNLAVDPQFISLSNGDLHEQTSSPLINSGDITAPMIPAIDLDNKNRTVCGQVDMGAYQHHPSPPIALTASANPSPGGNSVTFSAQLTGNCNVPTGVVTFLDGATPIGTGTLNGGAATSLTTAFLVVGQHTITARYAGDFNFEESTSNAVTETVTGFATATTLRVAPNPATAFQPISLTATVTASYGTPSGTVTFLANGSAVGSAALNGGGVAALSVSTLGAGTYNVVAMFNATTQYASSSSATVVEVVVGAPSQTTLTAQPNPIYQGQTVTFTAGVTGAGGASATGRVTGIVQFVEEATVLGTAAVQGGQASLATSALAVGSHTVTASYLGGGSYMGSVSGSVVVVVLASSFGIGLTPGTVTVVGGQSGQATVTATSVGVYAGTLRLGHGAVPVGMTVTFAPGTVGLAAGGTASSVVTVGTGGSLVAGLGRKDNGLSGWALAGLVAPVLFWRRRLGGVLVLCVAVGSMGVVGCGFSRTAYSTVAPGTYQVPITATDGGTVASAVLTVVVTR